MSQFKSIPVGLAAAALLAIVPSCRVQGDDISDLAPQGGISALPITRVVLYQSGVGYFERSGRVKGNVLKLRIRPDQVTDVLKSLTVVDFKGGQAVTISLPAERSKLMELSQLPPQVRKSGGLLAVAAAFRGATAVLTTSSGRYRGRIVGIENIGTEKENKWRITLLQKGGVLSSHPVEKIRSLRVLDKTLTVGLEKSLDVALNKGKWKPVTLTVRLSGKGPHDLLVSYIVPMTAWKPAYRIVMDEKGSEVLLQGWAVIDNLSGENWIRTRLSLTAGTPISFKYDLYTPRDVRRPDLTPQATSRAEAPPTPVDSTATGSAAPRPKMKHARYRRYREYSRSKRLMGRGGGGHASIASRSMPAPSVAEESAAVNDRFAAPRRELSMRDYKRSARAMVQGTSVGSLFRYDIATPVTIPDRSSALVSIVNKAVPGKDVLYQVLESSRPNPYRAVMYRNATDSLLERGPVAIYRKGAFVGEALSGRIERGAVSFLPYALEGRVIIHQSYSSNDEGFALVKINRGYVTIKTRNVAKFRYKVINRTGKAITLYVTRRRRAGWTLVSPKNAVMEKDRYFAPIPLAEAGITEFTVKEQTPVRRVLTVFDPRVRDAIALLLKGSEVPPEIAASLKKVKAIWDELGSVRNKMNTLKTSMEALRRRLGEVRSNLKVLGTKGNRDLRRKLAHTMTRLEARLNSLNRQWVELNMRRGDLREKLSRAIRGIRWERKE